MTCPASLGLLLTFDRFLLPRDIRSLLFNPHLLLHFVRLRLRLHLWWCHLLLLLVFLYPCQRLHLPHRWCFRPYCFFLGLHNLFIRGSGILSFSFLIFFSFTLSVSVSVSVSVSYLLLLLFLYPCQRLHLPHRWCFLPFCSLWA